MTGEGGEEEGGEGLLWIWLKSDALIPYFNYNNYIKFFSNVKNIFWTVKSFKDILFRHFCAWTLALHITIVQYRCVHIPLLFRSSAGDYFCEASNVHGSTAEAVHVDVLYPPECKSLPRTLSFIFFFMQSILFIGISFFLPYLTPCFSAIQQITLWALLASLARYLTWPLILFNTFFE